MLVQLEAFADGRVVICHIFPLDKALELIEVEQLM